MCAWHDGCGRRRLVAVMDGPDDRGGNMTPASKTDCPGCGEAQDPSPRYPKRFCHACTKGAVDGRRRPLEFANASMSGGFVWRHRGDGEAWHELDEAVVCLIRGVPTEVKEARFGGVVAEPFHASADTVETNTFGGRERIADLRR